MATWEDIAAFVRSEYRVLDDSGDEIRILIEYEDERSQVIIVCREVLDGHEDWVQIASVCGLVADVDLHRLLKEIGETSVVCGAVIMGEHVVLRHSLPLLHLDINEFVDPLQLVSDTADQVEEMFFGGDGY
ncbi:hypothetical protein ACL03H_20105 [Saccharopolyspora sp. MS10]|uniref:hypothetical protein n=1 Tax=Saccharopolyspora sp. MS10 TaxID=3385973 RepID=UPI0039A33BCA